MLALGVATGVSAVAAAESPSAPRIEPISSQASIETSEQFGTVTGRILDVDSQPVSSDFGDVLVTLRGIGVNRPIEAVTPDAGGRFTIQNVYPGKYRLQITDRQDTLPDRFHPYAGDPFEVDPHGSVALPDAHLKLRGAVEGSVQNADGSVPSPAPSVRATDSTGATWSAQVDPDTGRFRLMPVNGAAGEYTIKVSSRDTDYISDTKTVTIVDGAVLKDQEFVLPRAGSAVGHLIGPNGEPSSYTTRWYVKVEDSNLATVPGTGFARTDSNGGYVVKGLETGTYTFTYIWVGPYSATYRFAELRDVEVVAGEVTQLPEVVTDMKISPDRPYQVSAQSGPSSASLKWYMPVDRGDYPATSWVAEKSADGGQTWTEAPLSGVVANKDVVTGTVEGLQESTTYIFRIAQQNEFGTSRFSLASNPVTPTAASHVDPTPAPDATVVPAAPKVEQHLGTTPPKRIKVHKAKALAKRTGTGAHITWTSSNPKVCKIRNGKLVAGSRAGTCRIVAHAAGSSTSMPLTMSFKIRIIR